MRANSIAGRRSIIASGIRARRHELARSRRSDAGDDRQPIWSVPSPWPTKSRPSDFGATWERCDALPRSAPLLGLLGTLFAAERALQAIPPMPIDGAIRSRWNPLRSGCLGTRAGRRPVTALRRHHHRDPGPGRLRWFAHAALKNRPGLWTGSVPKPWMPSPWPHRSRLRSSHWVRRRRELHTSRWSAEMEGLMR